MSGPAFGFSVGDFISVISLIKTLITALHDSTGSKPQYRRLIEALFSLERALTEVKKLKVTAPQASQKIALEQVASQCQQSIERFLEDNAKFKETLSLSASASKWNWRTNLHKIQWAVCKDEAIAGLRAEVTGHTLTINTLLATIQLSSTFLQEEKARNVEIIARDQRAVSDDTNSIARKNANLLATQADLILSISKQVAKCSTRDQTVDLQTIMLKVLDTNMKIYTMVLEMQTFQSSIPPQIDRQQPVLFEDAHGRIAPFHVEFINSLEAFQAVMEVRFRHVPGLRKVQNNEYAIQEMQSKRIINLKAPWEAVFLPGRKFNMSMKFLQKQNPASSCPGCQIENAKNTGKGNVEVQCANPNCRLWYQRIVEVQSTPEREFPEVQPGLSTIPSSKRKRKRGPANDLDLEEIDFEDEIQHFRRVQVVYQRFVRERLPPQASNAEPLIRPLEPSLKHGENIANSQQLPRASGVTDSRPTFSGAPDTVSRNLTGSQQHDHRTKQSKDHPKPPLLNSDSTNRSSKSSASASSSTFFAPRPDPQFQYSSIPAEVDNLDPVSALLRGAGIVDRNAKARSTMGQGREAMNVGGPRAVDLQYKTQSRQGSPHEGDRRYEKPSTTEGAIPESHDFPDNASWGSPSERRATDCFGNDLFAPNFPSSLGMPSTNLDDYKLLLDNLEWNTTY